MALGLGLLRLPPAHFWAMTPRELAAAVRGMTGATDTSKPLSRGDLASLFARYPDTRTEMTP